MKRGTWIRRLAVLLCVVLCVPSLLLAMPATQTDAAVKYSGSLDSQYSRDAYGNYSTRNIKLQVEAGQEFNIGDWVSCSIQKGNKWQSVTLADIKGVKYKSTNKKALTLSSKGVAKTKKTGTTTITMKKGGINVRLQIQVVKKGSLTKLVKNSKEYQSRMKTAIKTVGSKITAKNYEAFFEKLRETEAMNRKIKNLRYGALKKGYSGSNKIVVPQYATYNKYRNQMAAFIREQPDIEFDIMSKKGTKMLQATAVKMIDESFGEMKLKEKVGLADIMKLNFGDSIYGYHFENTAEYRSSYSTVESAVTNEYTIPDTDFRIVSASGEEYPFVVTITYQSDVAVISLTDGKELPAGTYTLDDMAKKYMGDLTIIVP